MITMFLEVLPSATKNQITPRCSSWNTSIMVSKKEAKSVVTHMQINQLIFISLVFTCLGGLLIAYVFEICKHVGLANGGFRATDIVRC